MDPAVLRAMAKWPGVPAVYGWLALDRRGNWRLRESAGGAFGLVGHAPLRDFIGRNYAADDRGCWYFQNGPQRVYVSLAYTPLIYHYERDVLVDHCGRPTTASATYLDEEGSVLLLGERGIGLLDDRELGDFEARCGAAWRSLPALSSSEIATRFGFVSAPSDSLR